MDDRGYVEENTRERERMRSIVESSTEGILNAPVNEYWTVAGVLAHLAFWDQRAFLLLDQWEKTGKALAADPISTPGSVDWVNDAAKPMFLAMSPRRAAELAVSIARATDAKVAGLSDDIMQKNKAAGTPVLLLRAEHRKEHLDELEHVLRG